MSRIHDALRVSEAELEADGSIVATPSALKLPSQSARPLLQIEDAPLVSPQISTRARLVAATDPLSLGAEKFRVLATRLDHLRRTRELKSLQVTSAAKDDGKSLTSANLAWTLAGHTSSRVLLIEGDLHRPGLTTLFGLDPSLGLSHWWSDTEAQILRFVRHLRETNLWLLTAGAPYPQPSEILRSPRLTNVFAQLVQAFDWIIVDSPPMLPLVDANLWSRLLDGILLIVREGATPVNAIKKGLQGLDNPKVVGVVLNETSDFDQIGEYKHYYTARKDWKVAPQTKDSGEAVI
jgi:capsular exopolysaccharide synthesis family protein